MKMPFFGKREQPAVTVQTDVEAVRAKLAACAVEIREAEVELQRVSLPAALGGDDEAPVAEVQERLRTLRERREFLNAAHAAAQHAEHQAEQAARSREFDARRRAASQHAARLEREARAVSEIEAELLSHFAAMTDAASALVAALPAHMRSPEEPWNELIGPDALRDAALLEGYRQNRDRRAWLFQRQRGTLAFEDRETGALPALTDRIAGFTAIIRDHFNQAAPFKPQDDPPEAEPVSSAPVSDDVFSPSMSSGAAQREPRDEEVIDLRGRDLGIAKSAASEASIGEAEPMEAANG